MSVVRRGTPEHARLVEKIQSGRKPTAREIGLVDLSPNSRRLGGGAKRDKACDARVILERAGLGRGLVREFYFHPHRNWRFDLAYPQRLVAVEIEGRAGRYSGGVDHHTSWEGFENDCCKYSEAAVLGWTVLRCTLDMMDDGRMVDLVGRALGEEGGL